MVSVIRFRTYYRCLGITVEEGSYCETICSGTEIAYPSGAPEFTPGF